MSISLKTDLLTTAMRRESHGTRPEMPRIMNLLRGQTNQLHAQLTRHSLLAPVLSDPPSRERYILVLKKLWGWQKAMEREIESRFDWEKFDYGFETRRKAELIEYDLRILGEENSISDIPECVDLPDLSSPAKILGATYVLEGQTLGAQLLYSNLNHGLNLDAESGCKFLQCYGPDPMPKWIEFGQFMDKASAGLSDDEMVHSAQQTFNKLNTWFSV